MRRLRFTGTWPPVDVLNEYPNWEYALDEEDLPGQDETTIRPTAVQDFLAYGVAFSAGRIRLANGEALSAILGLEERRLSSIDVLLNGRAAWSLRRLGNPARWVPFVQDWLPVDERLPSVALDDATVFPLEVSSVLPRALGQRSLRIVINPSGSETEAA